MKKVIPPALKMGILMIVFLATTKIIWAQSDYQTEIQTERDSTNAEFADSTRSILLPEDLPAFHGLNYFPINENYRVMATFKAIKNGKARELKTSVTRTPLYKPYGTLSFKLNGKKYKLTLYQNVDPARPELRNYLLLAFTDLTNDSETYGGGRYLDFDISQVKEHMVIDFNRAYNPYCAYNHKYSCVIPPAENALKVRIEAGVKKYHE
jgi:uncharacterized protein